MELTDIPKFAANPKTKQAEETRKRTIGCVVTVRTLPVGIHLGSARVWLMYRCLSSDMQKAQDVA